MLHLCLAREGAQPWCLTLPTPLCLCFPGSFWFCPSVLLSLVSCLSFRLSVQLHLSVCLDKLSLYICHCLSVRLTPIIHLHLSVHFLSVHPCPSIRLTLKWRGVCTRQQAGVVPALSKPLSWPGDGKGLGHVTVAEGAWRSLGGGLGSEGSLPPASQHTLLHSAPPTASEPW